MSKTKQARTKRTPAPLKMWAVIVRSKKTEWIYHLTIDQTRRGAWEKYHDLNDPPFRNTPEAELNRGDVRLARVKILEAL